MSPIDRRSGNDRRAVPRFSVRVEVEWETRGLRRKGSLSDLSREGCFVLCTGDVDDGETVKLLVPVGEGLKVEFAGEIVNHLYEVGFAMRFRALGTGQRDFLHQFIDSIK